LGLDYAVLSHSAGFTKMQCSKKNILTNGKASGKSISCQLMYNFKPFHDIKWLGGVRASDLWSAGCEYDSRPCITGLVFGWVTVCGRVNHLYM